MGAMFIGQQFLQNVLDYSTVDAGAAILPAAIFMVLTAPRSAKLVETRGARFTLLVGYGFCLAGFLVMLLFWDEGVSYWLVGLAYALVGGGVGFARHAGVALAHGLRAGGPGRHGVGYGGPPAGPGRGDHAIDLGRAPDRRVRRRGVVGDRRFPESGQITDSVQSQLTKSFSSAANLAEQYPQYSQQIIAGAKSSFLDGADWAYTAGIVAIVLGAVLVFVMFPRRDEERRLLARYQGPSGTSAGPPHAEQGVAPSR